MSKKQVQALSAAFVVAAEASPGVAAVASLAPEESAEAIVSAVRAYALEHLGRTIGEADLEPLCVSMAEHHEALGAALRKRAARCRLRVVGSDEGAPASSSPPPSEACPACGIEGGHSPAVPCGVEPKAGN